MRSGAGISCGRASRTMRNLSMRLSGCQQGTRFLALPGRPISPRIAMAELSDASFDP